MTRDLRPGQETARAPLTPHTPANIVSWSSTSRDRDPRLTTSGFLRQPKQCQRDRQLHVVTEKLLAHAVSLAQVLLGVLRRARRDLYREVCLVSCMCRSAGSEPLGDRRSSAMWHVRRRLAGDAPRAARLRAERRARGVVPRPVAGRPAAHPAAGRPRRDRAAAQWPAGR